MKTILLVVSMLVGVSSLLFSKTLDLGDPNLVERFGMHIVKKKIDLYDPDEFGLWVLREDYPSKYQKVRNDEFELDDAKKWAFEKFKQKLKNLKPIDKNAEYDLYLGGVDFEKYDFKEQRFPLTGALEERSYMRYYGKGKVVDSYYRSSKLIFENADSKINFIPMEKSEAKKFIRSRKDKYGNIDRELVAHYIYTITNYEEIREFQPEGSTMRIKFEARLKSVDFMDKNRKHVLRHVDFPAEQQADQNTSKKLGE